MSAILFTIGVPDFVGASRIDVHGFPAPPAGSRERTRRDLGLDPDEFLFVNVGRLDIQKGLHVLLDAFAGARFAGKRARLLLVGDASAVESPQSRAYLKGLRRRADEPGLAGRVDFAGWRDDVPAVLHAADAYVHSSLWEGPPLPPAMLEAMASRLPFIGTDCPSPLS